jgi:hypothetical protein
MAVGGGMDDLLRPVPVLDDLFRRERILDDLLRRPIVRDDLVPKPGGPSGAPISSPKVSE